MAAPSFWDDGRKAQVLVQERAELARTVGTLNDLARDVGEVRLLWEMATEAGDESLTAEIQQSLQRSGAALEAFELKVVLSGPQDRKNVILSIHPGAGGTESQDWAQMLMRMYLRWAERAGFKAEVVDLLAGEEAGIKSATIEMSGEYAYGYLKGEIGVHRLIRISPFDASKRRHTSFASVAVIPEVEDVEVTVKDEELRVDVYRSSGPGGQGVNTADSAVRITHLPTGIVVACQNERSQLRNRDTAMRILRARLFSDLREEAEGGAGRADRREEGDRLRQPDPHVHVSSVPDHQGPPHRPRDRQCRRRHGRRDRPVHPGLPHDGAVGRIAHGRRYARCPPTPTS